MQHIHLQYPNIENLNMFAMWVVLEILEGFGFVGNPKAVSSASASTFGETLDSNWDHIKLYLTISCLWYLVVTGLAMGIYLQKRHTEKSPFWHLWVSAWSIARCEAFTMIYNHASRIKHVEQRNPNKHEPTKKIEEMSAHSHIDLISIDMLDCHLFQVFSCWTLATEKKKTSWVALLPGDSGSSESDLDASIS